MMRHICRLFGMAKVFADFSYLMLYGGNRTNIVCFLRSCVSGDVPHTS